MTEKEVILNYECPYRSNISGCYYCEHQSKKVRYCSWIHGTTPNCPMTTEELRKLKIDKLLNK